ncbi:MAG: tRNA (N(6)-L-threonylcarbamoyladenosine(37)-C(2))-methylthiotransferase MtaB [Dehalococcoidia bacterium]
MASRPVAAILTLGCKLNLADSEAIARGLRAAGYDVVDRMCEADAFVVNTCSVTHVADQKSRRLIRSVRRLSPGAAVAVAGCFPQTAGESAVLDLGADLVVGTQDDEHGRLVAFLTGRRPTGAPATVPAPISPSAPLRTRAFVKAQEGCNDVCAFCIVPRTRGREVSRPAGRVVADVEAAVEAGAREVVITGTQLGAWGRDVDPPLRPHHLIAAVLERTEVPRLRFSSLQPQDITPELLALWTDPRLMPHFHLALQSGSDAVLERMRRRYSRRDYLEAAERIRAAVPEAAITTDVIAGFPGETDADFEATLDLCREVGFARIHAFPYSQRQRTSAAAMPGQVPVPVRKARVQALIALGDELGVAFRRRFAGSVRPILWEGCREVDGRLLHHGYTDNYIPAYLDAPRGHGLDNRITPARIGGLYHDGVTATLPGGGP